MLTGATSTSVGPSGPVMVPGMVPLDPAINLQQSALRQIVRASIKQDNKQLLTDRAAATATPN